MPYFRCHRAPWLAFLISIETELPGGGGGMIARKRREPMSLSFVGCPCPGQNLVNPTCFLLSHLRGVDLSYAHHLSMSMALVQRPTPPGM
jgi:hypothetical protein